MRILVVLTTLFILAGCEHMEFVAVDYHGGHNYGSSFRHVDHISYTLGYYSGNYYNGYRVYGSHGHRYYHAPRNYRHHRHFARPVVVQHVHVHTSYCEHNYRPRTHYTPPAVVRTPPRHTPPRHTPPRSTPPRHTPPRRTPPRAVPPQVRNDRQPNREREQRNDRREDRQDRNDRRRGQERKRK